MILLYVFGQTKLYSLKNDLPKMSIITTWVRMFYILHFTLFIFHSV